MIKEIEAIKSVLAGESITDIAWEWGTGRLDRDPVLKPDKPRTHKNVDSRYPQFFTEDGPTEESMDKDALEEF